MDRVIIKAKRGNTSLEIPLIPYDNSLAVAWVEEIARLQKENVPVFEKDRIYSLNAEWDKATILSEIENCWNIIRKYGIVEGEFPKIEDGQDWMNRLHLLFEGLIGLDTERTAIFETHPKEFSDSVVRLNVLIHRYESLCRHENNPDYGRIVVTFEQKNKKLITDEQLALFTDSYLPGDVVVNYCHVGKPILDYIIDDDEHISPENIVPQSQWCGDFMLFFCRGPGHSDRFRRKVEMFWNHKASFMKSLGYIQGDPKLAFGRVPVAKTEEDPKSLKKRIFGITEIESVRVE